MAYLPTIEPFARTSRVRPHARGAAGVMLVPVDIAVDANRDGVIRFAGNYSDPEVAGKPQDTTTKDKPFRFWVNDDDDGNSNSDGEQVGSSRKDYTDGIIKNVRDLEDFTRRQIYIGGLQDAIANGDIKVGLKWRNTSGTPAIKIYTSADPDGSDSYLREEDSALAQTQGDYGFNQGEVRSIPTPISSTTASAASTNVAPPALTLSQAEIKKQMEAKINALYSTPIAVYGKVVDEKGSPIFGATVAIGINDKPARTGSDYVQTTDTAGLFTLTGVHGIAFNLRASKEGYYTTAESRGQRNVVVPANDDLPQPSESQPIVLVLRKKGETVPLIFVSSRQINVSSTGQPMNIDLATDRSGQGDLQVASWLGDSKQARFDWRYQLSIPGGGLIERTEKFDFEAPNDGHQSTAEIDMPAAAQGWSSDVVKNYFAKLPDGRYARFPIKVFSGEGNFVVLESYVNPTPGSRTLEFDPKQKSTGK